MALADAVEVITLEEEFLPEGKETVLPGDSFNLTVTRKAGVDIFRPAHGRPSGVYSRDKWLRSAQEPPKSGYSRRSSGENRIRAGA